MKEEGALTCSVDWDVALLSMLNIWMNKYVVLLPYESEGTYFSGCCSIVIRPVDVCLRYMYVIVLGIGMKHGKILIYPRS